MDGKSGKFQSKSSFAYHLLAGKKIGMSKPAILHGTLEKIFIFIKTDCLPNHFEYITIKVGIEQTVFLQEKRRILVIELTASAVNKVITIMKQSEKEAQERGKPQTFIGLRLGVKGGGCSGFSYEMTWVEKINELDKIYEFDGQTPEGKPLKLKVFVDQLSLQYLNNCKIDHVDNIEGSGFKFENPQVKSTCGCGSSFSV